MMGWELQNPGMAQGLRPKPCTYPWINSCPPPTAPAEPDLTPCVLRTLAKMSSIHSFIQQIVSPESTRCWGHKPVSAPPGTLLG